jgi:hypothetical protein
MIQMLSFLSMAYIHITKAITKKQYKSPVCTTLQMWISLDDFEKKQITPIVKLIKLQ